MKDSTGRRSPVAETQYQLDTKIFPTHQCKNLSRHWSPVFERGCPPEVKPYFATPELQEAWTKAITEVNQISDEYHKNAVRATFFALGCFAVATIFFFFVFLLAGSMDAGNALKWGLVAAMASSTLLAGLGYRLYSRKLANPNREMTMTEKMDKVLLDCWSHLAQMEGCEMRILDPDEGSLHIKIRIPADAASELEAATLGAPGVKIP